MVISVKLTKRFLDVALSLVGLTVCLPVFAVVAGAVLLESGGPVFYRQVRAGRLRESNGRYLRCDEFSMYKFRTMVVDAEAKTGAVLASAGDPRITRVGGFLRKTRLDESPQLWNVLIGQMSIVGPRPERPEILCDLAQAIPLFEERMRGVKPGLTGLAQIHLGYTGEAPEGSAISEQAAALTNPFDLEGAEGALGDDMRMKLLYDMAYVACLEKYSTFITTELSVIVKTPWVMLRGLGR